MNLKYYTQGIRNISLLLGIYARIQHKAPYTQYSNQHSRKSRVSELSSSDHYAAGILFDEMHLKITTGFFFFFKGTGLGYSSVVELSLSTLKDLSLKQCVYSLIRVLHAKYIL